MRDFVLRRHSVPILAAILVAGAAIPVSTPFVLLALIPLYGVASNRSLRTAIVAGAAVVAASVTWSYAWGESRASDGVTTAVLAAAVIAAGVAVAGRRAGAKRERALLAERAATEERLRIARELHDAVGHDVSLMVVQAQAVAATSEEPQTREAVDAIADLGRRTMAEMHRTLRALRDEPSLQPTPGLSSLGDVVDGARAAGVPITLTVEGAPRALAPALDASAYRIVQEAVTNVVRHAGGAAAAVTVHYGDALELTIADQGDPSPAGRQGHGLIGMRERAELFGGTLAAGPGERGFVVRATLPYVP